MRAVRLLAAVAVVAIAGSLAACAPAADEEESTGGGPNGYELLDTVDGVEVWYDRGEESGMTDVILMIENRIVGSCLGKGTTVCLQGDVAVQPYVIGIVPPTTAVAQAGWQDVLYDLQGLPGTEADADQVFFVAVPPPADVATMTPLSFAAYNEAGELVGAA